FRNVSNPVVGEAFGYVAIDRDGFFLLPGLLQLPAVEVDLLCGADSERLVACGSRLRGALQLTQNPGPGHQVFETLLGLDGTLAPLQRLFQVDLVVDTPGGRVV